jgi:hypothetical protein
LVRLDDSCTLSLKNMAETPQFDAIIKPVPIVRGGRLIDPAKSQKENFL